MIKAHVTSGPVHGALEAASRTAADAVDTGDIGDIGATGVSTTMTATPIDIVNRVAAYFAIPITVPFGSSSANLIVSPLRRNDCSSALLQSRSFSAQLPRRGTTYLEQHAGEDGAIR
jgi:hypothetical protein